MALSAESIAVDTVDTGLAAPAGPRCQSLRDFTHPTREPGDAGDNRMLGAAVFLVDALLAIQIVPDLALAPARVHIADTI